MKIYSDCGYTEIAVFRACGHAMCANPCYYQFIQTANSQTLKPKTIKNQEDGKEFIVEGVLNIGFKCYLCNQIVESVFRAEDVRFFEPESQEIAQQILESLTDVLFTNNLIDSSLSTSLMGREERLKLLNQSKN